MGLIEYINVNPHLANTIAMAKSKADTLTETNTGIYFRFPEDYDASILVKRLRAFNHVSVSKNKNFLSVEFIDNNKHNDMSMLTE